jgi:hypothetical protein
VFGFFFKAFKSRILNIYLKSQKAPESLKLVSSNAFGFWEPFSFGKSKTSLNFKSDQKFKQTRSKCIYLRREVTGHQALKKKCE